MVRLFAEALGEQVEVPDNPERIVSLAPAITETLYEIGAWSSVAGVSIYCNKPPEAKDKPKAGSYWKVLHSKLEELKPDLVLITTGAQLRILRELRDRGYVVFPVSLPISLHGLFEYFVKVGIVVNRAEEARDLVRRLEDRLRPLKGALSGLKIHYEIDLGGPVAPGAISYIADAFSYLGAETTFQRVRESWIVGPSSDAIKAFDPDLFVFELPMGSPKEPSWVLKRLEERGLGDLRALREKRLLLLDYDSLAHYGPSFFTALEELVERALRSAGRGA